VVYSTGARSTLQDRIGLTLPEPWAIDRFALDVAFADGARRWSVCGGHRRTAGACACPLARVRDGGGAEGAW